MLKENPWQPHAIAENARDTTIRTSFSKRLRPRDNELNWDFWALLRRLLPAMNQSKGGRRCTATALKRTARDCSISRVIAEDYLKGRGWTPKRRAQLNSGCGFG